MLEVYGNDARRGFLSRFGAIWVSKRIGEVVLMREKGPVGSYFERFREAWSLISVQVRHNARGVFIELRIPSSDLSCKDVYLKILEEEGGSGWRSFAGRLLEFVKAETMGEG